MASRIKHFAIVLSLGFIFLAAFSQATFAASKADAKTKSLAKRNKDNGQDGSVKVDGAAVYEAQNFDAPVMEYLDSGKEVKISKKIYPGIGGLGSFYKIRLRQNVFGYIADTDVAVKRKGGGGSDAESAKTVKEAKREKMPDEVLKPEEMGDEEPDENRNSFYYGRYFGLAYYTLNYAEQLSNKTYNAPTAVYGIKKTGPSSFFAGLPMDMNFLFTTTAPSFYSKISSKTSGMMLFADAVPFFPLSESKNYNIYFGLGLLLKYSRWSVSLINQPGKSAIDSEDLNIGVEGMLGTSFKLGSKVALRFDARYFYEKQHYFGMGGGLEFKY